jgi:NitT/TauT family transport system permease protein
MKNIIREKRKDIILKLVAPIVATLILLIVWEIIIVITNAPTWAIAKPTDIFKSLFTEFHLHWPEMLVTFKTILIAYPLAVFLALLVGALISTSEFVSSGIGNLISFLCCTPMMTLVPLLMIAMGTGIAPRIVVSALQTFPTMLMNANVGFSNVPLERRELMMSLKASEMQTFFKITLPSSISQVFTGLRLGFISCITCCIAAEFAGGNEGLGASIVRYTQRMRIPRSFAAIIIVALIGVVSYSAVVRAEDAVKTWKD